MGFGRDGIDAMELPNGLENAPEDVQHEILKNKTSSELVDAIREELRLTDFEHDSQGLQKSEKAELVLALRSTHRIADAEPQT